MPREIHSMKQCFVPILVWQGKLHLKKTSIKHMKYLGFAITSLTKYFVATETCCSETLKKRYFETRGVLPNPGTARSGFLRDSVPANRKELYSFRQVILDSRIPTHSGHRFLSNTLTEIKYPRSPMLCTKKEEKTTRWQWSNTQESVGRAIKNEHRAAFDPSFQGHANVPSRCDLRRAAHAWLPSHVTCTWVCISGESPVRGWSWLEKSFLRR